MNSIDLTPLYRSSIGFDRLASLLDNALTSDAVAPSYPPYNIEMLDENQYAITLPVLPKANSISKWKNVCLVLAVKNRKMKNANISIKA